MLGGRGRGGGSGASAAPLSRVPQPPGAAARGSQPGCLRRRCPVRGAAVGRCCLGSPGPAGSTSHPREVMIVTALLTGNSTANSLTTHMHKSKLQQHLTGEIMSFPNTGLRKVQLKSMEHSDMYNSLYQTDGVPASLRPEIPSSMLGIQETRITQKQ
ncbi:uncharacterized protein GJ701_011206 isoform 2-T4 [Geothlypis trichas]